MFSFLLAAAFLIMSDRAEFWDSDQISKNTEEISKGKEIIANFEQFQGQKVLLLVHGYNNDAKYALHTYRTIRENIDPLGLYDTIIGYLWPGYDEKIEYFSAEKNTTELASRVRGHIRELSRNAEHLDIFAHSMGNRLMLEALQLLPVDRNIVRNFYSLAPAVKDKDIEINHNFYRSVEKCDKMFVFHSNRDLVLKIGFFIAEWNQALGYQGVDDSKKEPKNVQFVDCTEFVDGHSAYFNALPLYKFIKNQQTDQTPNAMNVKLLSNGLISKIQ